MEKIALLPGGFKPPHAGHYNMAKWLATNTDADTVIVKVGALEREGITREMSLKLWDLYKTTDPDSSSDKLLISPSKHNSPVKDVYDYVENDAPEGSTLYLAMGEKEMKTNDQRFANIYKFTEPKGITFETKLVPPQAGGVSGTDMRGFINDDDQYSFFDYIPEHLTPEQKEQAWQIVTTPETSEWKPGDPVSFEMWTSDWNLKGFGKEYDSNFKNREDAVAYYKPNKAEDWAFKSYAYVAKKIPGFGTELEENLFKLLRLDDLDEDFYDPRNKYYDFAKSSEWKAGMPDGHKEDIPRAYKYKRGGMYNAATGQGGAGTMYENKYYLSNSNIQGQGAFAQENYPKGTVIDKLHDILGQGQYKFYELGKMYNHSSTPNCKNVMKNNTRYLVTIQPIKQGEELTADYRLQPDLEQPGVNFQIINETKYGGQYHLSQHMDQIKLDHGHQQYRNLQTLMSQQKDKEVNNWLRLKGYINEEKPGLWANIRAKRKKVGKKGMAKKGSKAYKTAKKAGDKINKETNEIYYIDSIDEIQMIEDALNEEYCPSCANKMEVIEEKKGKCTPTKGKRFAKRVNGKCRSFGQKGKAKKGGDRIRPGTKKGHAYCARSAKIKKCKNPPCANALSRKKWKCQGSRSVAESSVFSKDWWSNIINEILLAEGGAAGHMAHPFDLPDVTSGKDLKDLFVKAANSLQSKPGSIKIDGVNSSIRLVDLEGQKQFVMDRGSKKPLDIKGITKDDLGDRFKTKDGSPHGMVKVGGEVLDMFNEALPSLENDLKKLGAWDDPNILFNMEYVSGKTNVQDYDTNFIAIHGLNKIESKEVMGAKKMLIKRSSSEISYDKSDLQSMLDNLTPIAEKNGFEVYGSVPTEIKGKPNFGSALSKSYTIKSNKGDKIQSLDKWLSELNDIPKKDSIFINGVKKDAVSKLIYTSLLDGGNIDELFGSEEDKEKAIGGFVTYLATEKLGDEVLKVLDSPMGSADKHEGVVIRDEKIANVPFKITGKFILGGMYSDF